MSFGESVRELPESAIKEQILNLLFYSKIFCWPNNTAGFFNGEKMVKHRSRFTQNGTSDILALIKKRDLFEHLVGGDMLAIEVKTKKAYEYLMKHYSELKNYHGNDKKKRHLKEQIEFIDNVNANGGIGFFACSMEMVAERLGLKYK